MERAKENESEIGEEQGNNRLTPRRGRADVGLCRGEKMRENAEIKENVVGQNMKDRKLH